MDIGDQVNDGICYTWTGLPSRGTYDEGVLQVESLWIKVDIYWKKLILSQFGWAELQRYPYGDLFVYDE